MPSTSSLQLAKKPSNTISSSLLGNANMVKLTRAVKSLRFLNRAAQSLKNSHKPITTISIVSDKSHASPVPDILIFEKIDKQSKSILKLSPVDNGELAIIPILVHAKSTDTLNTISSTNTDLSKLESSSSDSSISTTSSAASLSSSSTIEDELDAIDPRPINPKRTWSLESLRSCIRKPRPAIRRIAAKKSSKCVRFGAVVEYEIPNERAESAKNEDYQLVFPTIPDRLQSRTQCLYLSLIIVAVMIRFVLNKVFDPHGEIKGYSMELHQPIPGFYDAEEWDS